VLAVGAPDHCPDVGPVPTVAVGRRERHPGLPQLAVPQDQQIIGMDAFAQDFVGPSGGGQRREPRMQRG
jgi:hypothetical protein